MILYLWILVISMISMIITGKYMTIITRDLLGMMLFLPPLGILTCNSANKQSFQNVTKDIFAQCSIDVKSAVIFCRPEVAKAS